MDQQNHNTPQTIGDAASVPNYVAGATLDEVAFQHLYRHRQQQQKIRTLWANQYSQIEQANLFENHILPLARIKKIMKADDDVQIVTTEALVVFARACEMFILELTSRGWSHAEKNNRQSLQRNDIAIAIRQTEIFDFLVDIVPTTEEEGEG